jgi:hypothetical protein
MPIATYVIAITFACIPSACAPRIKNESFDNIHIPNIIAIIETIYLILTSYGLNCLTVFETAEANAPLGSGRLAPSYAFTISRVEYKAACPFFVLARYVV